MVALLLGTSMCADCMTFHLDRRKVHHHDKHIAVIIEATAIHSGENFSPIATRNSQLGEKFSLVENHPRADAHRQIFFEKWLTVRACGRVDNT